MLYITSSWHSFYKRKFIPLNPLHLFLTFYTILKVTLQLQLLQNTGYIPCVVQYILVAYLTPNSLYLPLPHPDIVPPFPNW